MNAPNELLSPGTRSAGTIFRFPEISDGGELWRIARDSRVLDVNSSYAYTLWCRDFRTTSAVCEAVGEDGRTGVAGFITGYIRPAAPDTLFVWQIAVDEAFRGQGLALEMLRWLLAQTSDQGVRILETTISPDNAASRALFTRLADSLGVPIARNPLFAPADFPDAHEAEDLYTVGNRHP